jgi:hypothetical protein
MKESLWGYLIIALGISIIVILLIVQNLTTTSQQDYYLSKEVVKSAMLESIDGGTYRDSGEVIMSKEKFVSIVTRRFAESVSPDRTYQLDFYDIHEYPPMATVKISTTTGESVVQETLLASDINTYITNIIETAKVPEEE